MRLVLDTNVVIAGMLWRGSPRMLMEAIIDSKAHAFTSIVLIEELANTLRYPKLTGRLSSLGLSPSTIVARYALIAETVIPAEIARTVPTDPDDDKVLACALAAQADIVVSGDADLLNLKTYQGIPIVNAVEVLRSISSI